METRIIQLESLLALQDETIARLHEELYRQQQDITRLLRRLEVLAQRLDALEPQEPVAGSERPPHY